ncbi:MAG: cupin domain-containing protein [Phreatobacter sp.]|uniref:cupin domain-containing protein n=1 Tax=Phreatobacter sp. TaxID=1966341 RepID=UPI0027326A2F|nr:cupin domain-containing protein [Phreatobacter sp.]MDP2801658.1 cupin domain-containing protein [Phreatobacter sp.]
MTTGTDIFLHDGDVAWTDLGGGVKRKILTYDASVMLVRVVFEKGAVGAPHYHHHIQCTLVASGRFEVTIGDRSTVLAAGDSFIVPTNVVHSVIALEAGELVDTFTPLRQDFL